MLYTSVCITYSMTGNITTTEMFYYLHEGKRYLEILKRLDNKMHLRQYFL